MATFNKPEFNSVWASGGTKTTPPSTKVVQGWVVEIPPFEYDNWVRNRQDEMLAHINQAGIVAWDVSAEYQAGKSYVQSPSGVVFKALTTHTGINPDVDVNGNWEVAFQRSGEALLKSQNLADVPDKAQARTNLGIATTADYDSRYLRQVQNLADLPSKPTARGNLDVYSRQEVIDLINNLQPAGEVSGFARNTAPNGWLVCDGSTVSRTAYARLFAAIGTVFGAGNGSTTFQIPDLRGEFVRGWDIAAGNDPSRIFGSKQEGAFLSHTHPGQTNLDGTHSHAELLEVGFDVEVGISGAPLRFGMGDNYPYQGLVRNMASGSAHRHTFTTSSVGGNETRPRNVALLYCIRT